MKQLNLIARKRKGPGGRPPNPGGPGVSHLRRPPIRRTTPVHVTIRMRRHVYNLRSRRCFRPIEKAFLAGRDRFGFRLNHFSVQGNHVHLIAEAHDEAALSRGMQGLAIRIAKALNRVMNRKGAVFADRYFADVLRTVTEARHAVHYVLHNRQRHSRQWGPPAPSAPDPYSSAGYLSGASPTCSPRTVLLARASPANPHGSVEPARSSAPRLPGI
jgi:REP element-mobilizing transposase RayT